ncbi:MAG TPA: NADPH-dependent FMN reductase [Acetobacteraceae bacterium]|nr:NADPH-dependent FMN reductase [Acetobacteraceae bacterium]
MEMPIAHTRLLGLCGSLRRESYSRAVLHGLEPRLPAGTVLDRHDLRLPLYDEDEDGPATPDPVRAFRQMIAECDGLLVVTPEYNHGIPGVLKNALDWASRPYGDCVLIGKPALIISTSPGFVGGARAQAQVNETLLSCHVRIVTGPQVVIGNIAGKIRDGRLVDEPTLQFAAAAVDRLLAICREMRRSVPA